MKIVNNIQSIKCDTLMCKENAHYKLELNTYKDDLYLCSSCFKNLKSILKKDSSNEAKK